MEAGEGWGLLRWVSVVVVAPTPCPQTFQRSAWGLRRGQAHLVIGGFGLQSQQSWDWVLLPPGRWAQLAPPQPEPGGGGTEPGPGPAARRNARSSL